MKKQQNLENSMKQALTIPVVMPRFLLRPFYLLLKKDMVRRLSKKHGEEFIDDVMETFEIPTNLMDKYFKN